jgi:hypothetical protein
MLPDGTWILPDGGILLPDGQIIDVDAAIMRFTPEPDFEQCELSEDDTWEAEVTIEDEGGFSLAPGVTGFGLAYRAIGKASGTTNCAQNIEVMHIPETGAFPAAKTVLGECPVITDVSLARADSSGWQLAWVDNFTNMAELHGGSLDGAMKLGESGRRTLTDNAHLERKPVVTRVDGRPLVAWTTSAGNEHSISAQWLDGDATAVELVAADEGHEPQGLALSAIGPDAAAVGWVGPESNPGVWLLRLGATGARVGAPIQLTQRVAVSSSIDLVQRNDGGAAVYSIEIDGVPQVRFRRLDGNGMPVAEERIVVGPPLAAQDASIYELAAGYAVVYRALPAGAVKQPQIRMTFVSKEGTVMRDSAGSLLSFAIAPATMATARVDLVVSVEGRLMIAWLDADSDSDNNALKVVRRRLYCGG